MTFDEWFLSKQGEPYDSMYVFARDAWSDAQSAEREACAIMCEVHSATVMEPNNGTPWSACHECASAIRSRV